MSETEKAQEEQRDIKSSYIVLVPRGPLWSDVNIYSYKEGTD